MKTNIFANDFISICRNSKLAKCINLITMLSLVIWSFGPGIAIMVPKAHAEEVPSITETVEAPTTVEEIVPVIETPTTEEQVTPVAEAQPTETEEITTPEKTTPAESNVTQESQPVLSVWTNDGNKYTTTNTVELGTTYTSPQNDQVTVTFTKLPENPGKLSIEEITLTAEQITLLSALSDKAYDITSDMADGTFAFDLNLPKPANQENVQIKFAETEAELENAETVATNDITTEADSISVSLNHFTIFVVTKDETPLTGQVCINAGATTGTNCYSTIQAAINAALSGDTINVATGTYNEHITINKAISLLGADKTTTFIDGTNTGVVVTIGPAVNNVVFKNFTVRNSGADIAANAGIILAYSNGDTIENNIFTNNANGVGLLSSGTNSLKDNAVSNSARYGIVMDLYPGDTTHPSLANTLHGNTITSSGRDGVYVGQDSDDNIIEDNDISGTTGTTESTGYEGNGLYLWKSSGNTVTNNIISNNLVAHGIEMMGSSNNTITDNTITGNLNGLVMRHSASYANNPNTFNKNNISGNTTSNLNSDLTIADGNFIAQNNWWGNSDLTTITSKITGSVTYSPWCTNIGCTEFGPVMLTSGATKTGYSTISSAINAALSGDTINVATGTYNESQILVDKPLTLQGAGYETTIIDGGNIALTNPGLVRITANGTVTLSGFTIQNTGAGNKGIGVYVDSGTATVKILDNTINKFGKAGIVVHTASSVQIERNIISATDHDPSQAPNGIQIGNLEDGAFPSLGLGITGTVKDNEISGCSWANYISGNGYDGEGSSGNVGENWTGSGILVIDTSADLKISNNNIHDNNVGIDIEAGISTKIGESNTIRDNAYGIVLYNANPTINKNKIENNSTGGVLRTTAVSQSGTVDATNNWWETAIKTDIQNKISGNVTFTPFYTSSDMDAFPEFNGDVTGHVGATGLDVSGYTISTDGTLDATILGTLTEYSNPTQRVSFGGTVSGDISGNVTGGVNYNGYDTLFAEITNTGASDHVYLIGQFDVPGMGNFSAKFITRETPIDFIDSITVSGPTSVPVGENAQMTATPVGGEAGATVAWSVWTSDGINRAEINQTTGLLTATSVGSVTVIASALDGSLVTQNYPITITPDTTAPTLTVTGFTKDGVDMSGTIESGYTLNTNNVSTKEYAIQFKSGTVANEALANEYFGLYLKNTSTVSADDLKTYYADNTSGEFLTYLNGAADGINPFAYIKGDGTTSVQLIDGARHQTFAGSQNLDMAIPDDAPLGTYVLEGTIKDVAGNETTVTYKLIVVGDREAPMITLNGANPQTIELGTVYTELGATTDDGSTIVIDASAFINAIGSYAITYNATDSNGNVAIQKTRTVNVVDTTKPATPIISTPAQSVNTNTINIIGTAEADSTITITGGASTATGTATGGNYEIEVTLNQNTVNTLSVTATDAASNESNVATVTITQDNIVPTVVLSDNHDDSIVKNGDVVIFTATFTEANQINEVTPPTISINSDPVILSNAVMTEKTNLVWTYTWTVPSGHDGLHSVIVSATDNVGNGNTTATGKNSYTIDNTVPTITIDSYNTNPTNQNITVNASTNEGTLNADSHLFTGNDGFTFVATDTAGNSTSRLVTVTNIDKTSLTPDNFTVSSPTLTTLALSWTNNELNGSYYTIKRSTSAITEDNFDAATNLGGAPIVASGVQGYIAQNLLSGTTYYFAIKMTDAVGNVSAIGTASGTTASADVPAPTDDIAPAATDLSLSAGTIPTSQIKLDWSATGDDVNTGMATKYVIKRSTSAITSDNFDLATTVFNSLSPKSNGSAETLTVSGLISNTQYCFALKVQDEVSNTSAISNSACLTTLDNLPIINDVSPSTGQNDSAVGITITGTNFMNSATTVRFTNSDNTFDLTGTYNAEMHTVTATVGVGTPAGVYGVRIIDDNGTSAVFASAYTVTNAPIQLPAVTDVVPSNIGDNDSNVNVEIYGTGFTGVTKVDVDDGQEVGTIFDLTFCTVVSTTKITCTIDGKLHNGTYNVRVTNGAGTNSMSAVQIIVTTPVVIDSTTVQDQETDQPIDMGNTSTIPVQITMNSNTDNSTLDNNTTIEVVIPPATDVTMIDDNGDTVPYTGNINPPQLVKPTEEIAAEAGDDAVVITMGNPNQTIEFSNDFVVTVTLESTSSTAPLIWYYNPSSGLEIAGKDGVKDGVTYVKGGTVLNSIDNGGTYTHTIGLLLDHMSSYVAGVTPTITSVSPSSSVAGSSITITGTNFGPGATVKFDSILATSTVNSETQISATVPSVSNGSYTLRVTNTDTLSASTSFTVTISSSGGGGGGSYTYSSARSILTFTVSGGSTVISENNKTITVTVPSDTNVTALVPSITVSGYASINPNTGVVKNFTSPVIYTVTAQNGTTQTYTVSVVKAVANNEGQVLGAVYVPDGGLIRVLNTLDVYIVKRVGTKQFKRLILSPEVFNSYQHLKWSDVVEIDQATADSFVTSDLVRMTGDTKVYKLYPNGDIGEKRWIKTAEKFLSMGFDWDAVYTINQKDRDSYTEGLVIE